MKGTNVFMLTMSLCVALPGVSLSESQMNSSEKNNCTLTFQGSMNSKAIIQPPELRGKEALLKFDGIGHDITTFDVFAEPSSKKYSQQIESGKIDLRKPFMKFDPAKTPPQPDHMEDFFNCVRNRKKPKCNEDEAFIEAVSCIMSVIAYEKKRQVRWDPVKQQVV